MTAHRGDFRLTEERWIPVRLSDGSSEELSLHDAFHRADDIREIGGELPTQTFAILRLLLAILYRATSARQLTVREWESWGREGLPLPLIDDYLAFYADRFDLFDAERPFFQVTDLAIASGGYKGVGPLILDLPTRNRLFTNRGGSGAAELSFAEAARWLVNAHAFDPSGIKSGAIGDPRVKGGKGFPIGVAWAGLLGGIYAEGATLRETLLLNLVVPGAGVELDPDADIPPWEEVEPDTAAEREGLLPHGPVRLYTWQSRRIRLFREGDRVVGCIVANGDKLTPQNRQRHEPMTAWRFSDPQTKARKHTTYMPRQHQPDQALWRGIAALIPGLSPFVPQHAEPAGLVPGLVDWIASQELGFASDASTVRLRSVGVVYGSNNSVVDEMLVDEIVVPLLLLRESSRALALQAEEAVRLAAEGVRHLRNLAENLQRAAGGEGDGAQERAGALAYAALDGPYRVWLAGLSGDEDPLDAIAGWKLRARDILWRLGRGTIADAGPAAWAGRRVSRGGRTELITTPRAEGWFLRGLSTTFGPIATEPIIPRREGAVA